MCRAICLGDRDNGIRDNQHEAHSMKRTVIRCAIGYCSRHDTGIVRLCYPMPHACIVKAKSTTLKQGAI